MDRRRYSHRDRPNRQEIAAQRRDFKRQHDLAMAGHDDAAASRARRVVRQRELQAELGPNLATDELRDVLRETCERHIAEIYAEGPVGCTCTYPECVQTRPTL